MKMIKRNRAFSFVELMVVIAIMGIIFAVTTVTYTNVTKNSRDARRKSDMESIRQALELCRSYAGEYPDAASGGKVPTTISCGSPAQVYMQTVPVDPKDNTARYNYVPTGGITYTLSTSLMESGSNLYTVTNP